jgi:endonuclease/exonuclease/phosphatase family metal-dependent hydrolase
MSFNIRYGTAPDGDNAWEKRRALLIETITTFDPDLLGTQECLATQADELRAALPGHGFVGAGRDDGALAGEMCAIYYRASRFERLDEGHFWLSEAPEVPGSRSWDSALPRIASWVKLRCRADTTRMFVFFNTHFDHVGSVARRESARLLRARIAAIAAAAPVIVTGDFNAPADPDIDGPYRELVRPRGDAGRLVVEDEGCSRGLFDVYRALHNPSPDEGTYHGFAGDIAGSRIDWVLVSLDLVPVKAAIVREHLDGRYPSDHFPVTALVRFPPGER